MDKQEAVEDNDPYSILSIFEIERITENTIEELPDQCKSIFKLSRINVFSVSKSDILRWRCLYILLGKVSTTAFAD